MTEAKEKKCLLDLVPDQPHYSDTFEFGVPAKKYKFRLLDTAESQFAIVAAQRKVLEQLTEAFDRETALKLMVEHGPNADLHTWWQELFALQAALCDEKGAPVAEGSADERASRLADVFSPIERHELATLYSEFADEHDPLDITDEQVEEIVEAEGPTLDPGYWRQLGSRMLRRCSLTLARRLAEANHRIRTLEAQIAGLEAPETSPTHKSSGG